MDAPGTTDSIRLPTREMLVVGGVVLAISVAAFFRVPLLPTVGGELGLSAAQLGLITTVFAIGRLATDIPAGRAADRLPAMAVLGYAGLTLVLGSIAFGLAQSLLWVVAAAFVLGVASSVANTTGMTYFSTAAPTHQRGMAMAGFSAALLGGQALGPMAGGLLGAGFGWRAALFSAAAVGVVVAVVGTRAARAHRSARPAQATATPATGPGADPSRAPDRVQRAVLYAVPFASFFALGAMPQTLIPIIGAQQFELGPSRIGVALGIGGACRLVGSLAGGRVADRVSRKASLVPGLALFALGAGSFGVDLGVGGWVAGIVLLSLGSYGIGVGATMLADYAEGAGVGRRLGTYRFVGDLGLIAGPVASALLYERVGVVAAVTMVASPLLLVALLAAFVLAETRWLDAASVPAAR